MERTSIVERVRTFAEAVNHFVRVELWEAPTLPKTAYGRALSFIQFTVVVGEGFVRDRLLLRASALSYFTVISVIPLVAVAVSIVGAVGVRNDQFAEVIVQQITAGSPDAQARILELIRSANFGGLGTLSAIALFVTTVLGVSNIEHAFNGIWGVQKQRSWARRFPDYLAVIVVAPLLLGAALSLGAAFESPWLVDQLIGWPLFAKAYEMGLQQADTLMMCAAFTFVYWFLPNTRVKILPALLGGLIAGYLVLAAQRIYLGFSIGVGRYDAMFGGAAALPLLFVWIYVFWAVVLFGAEVAFAYQNLDVYRREVWGRPPGPAERESIGTRIAIQVARAFRDRRPPLEPEILSRSMHVPVRTIRQVIEQLEGAGIVAPHGEGEMGAVQLGRPAEDVHVYDILKALRGSRDSSRGDPEILRTAEGVLSELQEDLAKGPGQATLAELLAGLPPEAESAAD